MDSEKYKIAVRRNLAELQWALLHRTTLQGIEKVSGAYSYFLHSAYTGLFNDYVSHCIKVFEKNRGSGSFWYIEKTNKARVRSILVNRNLSIEPLEVVSAKLKHIRDKTHFHIDVDGMINPQSIWKEADLVGSELGRAVDNAWTILSDIQNLLNLSPVTLPTYSIDDARKAATAAENVGR